MSGQSSDPWLMSDDRQLSDNVSRDNMKFSDNFEPQSQPKQIKQIDDCEAQPQPLPDSQQYIQSLERKLDKLKGKTKDISGKQVIESLSIKRDAILHQLLDPSNDCHIDSSQIDSQTNNTNLLNNSNIYQYVERRLFPQMQALTEEELQRLLEADVLQKINKQDIKNSDHRKTDNQ